MSPALPPPDRRWTKSRWWKRMPAGRFRCTGKASYLAEQAAAGFFARLPIVIVRPPNVLGTGQRELLAVMKLLRRRIVPLIGRREKQTSICFVQDLVRALVLAAEHDRAAARPISWRRTKPIHGARSWPSCSGPWT